jgi:lactoylglutathione lyase
VPATLTAWRDAFGLTVDYAHEDGIYGELATGETTLAFAETEFGRGHFEDAETRAMFDGPPRRFEVGLVTEDVLGAYDRATASGMRAVRPPFEQPWGQTVCWVRDANGILIELSSPVT